MACPTTPLTPACPGRRSGSSALCRTPMMNHLQFAARRIGEYAPWRQRALDAIRAHEEKGDRAPTQWLTRCSRSFHVKPRLRCLIGGQAKTVARAPISPGGNVRVRSAASLLDLKPPGTSVDP